MAIIAHIEENEPSPVALSKHSCPLCSYEWWELTDADDYPYYCPGCGKSYSPRDSEVYAEEETHTDLRAVRVPAIDAGFDGRRLLDFENPATGGYTSGRG